MTDDMPQKNWAPTTRASTRIPPDLPIASIQICAGGTPVGDVSAFW